MSDFNTARNLPNAPDAYNVWYGWVFGLPEQGQISSDTCGAMPFRKGDGLCSISCLRGEDIAFLNTAMTDARTLVSPNIWTDFYPAIPTTYLTPHKSTITQCYNFLSAMQQAGCYGTGISLNNSGIVISDYRDKTAIKNSLTGKIEIETQPPDANDNRLRLSELSSIFKDMKKTRCTIADAVCNMTGSTRYYYDWYSPSTGGGSSTLDVSNISSVYVGTNYGNKAQMISAEGMMMLIVTATYSYNGDSQDANLLLAVGGKFTMTSSYDNKYRLYADVNITGEQIANVVCSVTGWNTRPSGTQSYAGSLYIRHRYRYLAVWPKWLVDY